MAGLLGQNTSGGLLSGLLGNRGATPDALRRKQEEDARRAALLATVRPPAPAPQQPERERGQPGFLTYLRGGRAGLASERGYRREEEDRQRAEAMRPQMEAQRREILQTITDPRERALFMADPGAWAENVGYQFRPRTLAPGSVERLGGQTVGGAPVVEKFDDRFGIFDPLNPQAGAQYTDARAPTFSEETGRINANNPINVAPGGRAVDPRTGEVIAEGAPRVFAAGDGVQLYDEGGRQVAENVRDAPPVDPRAAQQAAGTANAALERIRNTRAKVAEATAATNGATAGFFGGLTARVAGTPAANLAATIDTIEANLSFSELQKMRDNSPTGGALGQVTERELALLGATVASLRQSQSPEQLRRNLAIIDESLNRWEAAVRQSQQAAPAQGGTISREAAIAEARRRGLIR